MIVKKLLIGIFLLSNMIVAGGCAPRLSEEQVIKLVESKVEKDGMGEIEIISVTHQLGEYVVKWERESNCESGTEYIDDRSGKLKHGMQSIC